VNDDASGAKWFKSSHSEGGANCVEVAWLGEGSAGIRDSKNPHGPALTFTPNEWDAFVASARSGAFNRA
jgi:hypothetical protein